MRTPETQTVPHEAPIPPAINLLVRRSFLAIMFSILFHAALCQPRSLTGRVTNEKGENLPGVNVVIKGTTVGAVTDSEGHYFINIPNNEAALIFSFVGYTTIEALAGPRTTLAVEMTPNVTSLNEVVVTGYSSIDKKDLSSSIAVVDVEDMKKYASSNFAEQLMGKVPGVQITTTSDPGSSQSIRIRGIGSVNNNEPLYVIDGVPIQSEANFNFLNPNDIESMQVLKDAAAASIYGARAANGVIVITTRKGKGKSKLSIDFYTGVQEITKTIESADPAEMLEIKKGLVEGAGRDFNKAMISLLYIKEADGNWTVPDYYALNEDYLISGYREGDPAVDPSKYFLNTAPTGDYSHNYPITKANKEGTDWFDEMFRPATIKNVQVSASGGGAKGNFYLSANYFDQEGIMIRNSYQRFQTRINSIYNIKDNIRMGENVNIAYETGNGALGGGGPAMQEIIGADRIIPVYDIDGYWAPGVENFALVSSNVAARQNRFADGEKGHTWRMTGNIFGEVDFLKRFTFKTSLGLDYSTGPKENYSFTCPECAFPAYTFPNRLGIRWFDNSAWVWSSILSFNTSFGEHGLAVLGGVERRRAYSESSQAVGIRLTYGDDPNYRLLSNADPSIVGSFKTEHTMSSFFLNANYDFKEKYFFTVTARRDGSSRFMNNKYGLFPAASAGWRISNEPFMEGADILSDLKLRASYGATGNNEVLGGDYPGYTSFSTIKYATSYDINGTGNSILPGFAKTTVGNPDLKWETSIVTDIGMDATLGKHVDLTVDFFQRVTKDMIFPLRLSLQEGGFYQNQNIGSMENKGVEFLLTFRGATLKNSLNYSISLAGTHYQNKVLALDANDNTFVNAGYTRAQIPITRTEVGHPISQFRGYITDGVWQSQEQIDSVLYLKAGEAKPGRMKFQDLNNDGVIDDLDRTYIGSPIPKLSLGLTFTLSYKNFDFTAFLSGVYGRKVFDNGLYYSDFNSPFRLNPSKRMLYDAGKTLPELDADDSYSSQPSSYYVDDGSYTRLRNIVLGYTFSRKLSTKIGLRTSRIFIQGQNLFTWTSYHGLDPEGSVNYVSNGNEPGRDYVIGVDNFDSGRYPPARQVIIGINFEF